MNVIKDYLLGKNFKIVIYIHTVLLMDYHVLVLDSLDFYIVDFLIEHFSQCILLMVKDF